MAATIEFYWDAVSPYTYLASTQIDAVAARHGARVQWKPVLLGGVFEASGNKPPISVPAKGRYMGRDLKQWAAHYDIPFAFPKNFPASSLAAQRVACALPEAQVGPWAQATMSAYWGRGDDISQPDTLKALAAGLGLDGEALLAQTQDPAIKERLKQNTAEAVERGAFGAPTFFIGKIMFWGNDRFALIEEHLARNAT
ncbi:MAG: 2-hydroxychromene-2-carboxylate isomerase [Solimonas sp.]